MHQLGGLFCWYARVNTFAGVSEVLDRHLHGSGQRGDVEYKVRELGQTIFRAAVLSQGLLPCKFMERWISNPKACSSMWPDQRSPYKASLNWLQEKEPRCHEGVTWGMIWWTKSSYLTAELNLSYSVNSLFALNIFMFLWHYYQRLIFICLRTSKRLNILWFSFSVSHF